MGQTIHAPSDHAIGMSGMHRLDQDTGDLGTTEQQVVWPFEMQRRFGSHDLTDGPG